MADAEKLKKKKHQLKRPKAVLQKTEFGPKCKYSTSHICNSFFENIISGIQLFYIRPHVPVVIIRVSFLFQIFQQRVSKPRKTSQKDHSFYNTVSLKNLTPFTSLDSLYIEYKMLPKHCQKPFSLYKFSSKHVSV